MKRLYSAYTIYLLVLPVDIYEVMNNLTPVIIKFMILGIIVPPVAIAMLFQDENSKSPSPIEIILTFFTSLVFVWLGYEASIETDVPVVAGLAGTFFLGLFSLPVIIKVKKHLVDLVGNLIDSIGDWVKKLTK